MLLGGIFLSTLKRADPAGPEIFTLLKSHDVFYLASNFIGAFFRESQFLPQEIKQNTVADNNFPGNSAALGSQLDGSILRIPVSYTHLYPHASPVNTPGQAGSAAIPTS